MTVEEELNGRFGIPGVVDFVVGNGGLTKIVVVAPQSRAEIYVLGAHITHWQPKGAQPVIWLSRASNYVIGQPIRGGVPVCFPWFGPLEGASGSPLHGYVRLIPWDVESVDALPDGSVAIGLWIKFYQPTAPTWPGNFELHYRVTMGAELAMSLEARNCQDQPLTITEALHTYLCVSDVRNVSVVGLAGRPYVDKVDDGARKVQGPQPVTFEGETDRAYLNAMRTCVLRDAGLGRCLRVSKSGSGSTVVWNPWVEKARKMPDFGDDEWPGMVCIETANALSNAVTIPPMGTHTMEARISVAPLASQGDADDADDPAGAAAEARADAAGPQAAVPPFGGVAGGTSTTASPSVAAPQSPSVAKSPGTPAPQSPGTALPGVPPGSHPVQTAPVPAPAPTPAAPAPGGRDWTRFTARIYVRAGVPSVFEAWATAAGLTRWFVSSAEFRPPSAAPGGPATPSAAAPRPDGAARPGDDYLWRWDSVDYQAAGSVLELSWPDRLAFTFAGPSRCELRLRPAGEMTCVELFHTALPTLEMYEACRRGWTFCLANLKSVLEGGIDLRDVEAGHGEVVNR
jgi:glucose-6-phosphate 1-epimerase